MQNNVSLIKEKLIELGCEDKNVFTALLDIQQQLILYSKIEECLYDGDLYLIYKHTDPNGKIYFGITQNHPQTRWNEGAGYEKQSKFYRAIQKYGWINFKHEIIEAGLSREKAEERENELIIQYKTYDTKYGYNTQVHFPPTESLTQEEKQKKTTLEFMALISRLYQNKKN